jgi:Sugar phosphate isomerases/epimerases
MKLSLSNGIFSKLSLEENFQAVVKLGFENFEFNMKSVKKEHDTDVYREKRLREETKLDCLTLHAATLHMEDPVEVYRAVYYGKISLECAKALYAPIMTVHSNIAKTLTKAARKQCLERYFGEIIPFAKVYGVKLALENLSVTSTGYGKNVEELEEILDVIDPKREMGITFDLCHALETGVLDELLEKYAGRICNVHMANRDHQPFTEKTPELHHFLSTLHHYDYEGPITLELEHTTSTPQIAKTKAFFDKLLKEY